MHSFSFNYKTPRYRPVQKETKGWYFTKTDKTFTCYPGKHARSCLRPPLLQQHSRFLVQNLEVVPLPLKPGSDIQSLIDA